MKIILVCGARPNFMKIAPLIQAFKAYPDIRRLLVHTGQHYDDNMSSLFFDQLAIPKPDINLAVGGGSHAEQTAQIMLRFEPILNAQHPDAILVVGDVNSTIACSLVASKLGVPIIHVEAGLRSFDRSMPEEINRILTDAISDLLMVSEPAGVENLKKEGIAPEKIHLVGNVMIDTLRQHQQAACRSMILKQLDVTSKRYGVITLHRPGNVDQPQVFGGIIQAFETIQKKLPLIFCVHPRTLKQAEDFGLLEKMKSLPDLKLVSPLGYLEFLHLMSEAKVVFTDSGGIQEETTILKVPCLTLRKNTERPITLTHGTNRLVGSEPASIIQGLEKLDELDGQTSQFPPLWDGRASERIVAIIHQQWA